MKLNVLLAALPQLSFADITTIRAACDHLLSAQQYDPVDQTHPLYDEMTRLLNVGLTFRDFHNLAAYKTWKQKAPAVVRFIEENFPEAGKLAKTAMMTFLIEALIDDLKERGVPVTVGTLTNNIDRLPALFDECYPGYRQAGLTNIIVSAMSKSE